MSNTSELSKSASDRTTALGIAVHVVGLFFGVIGAGIVYLVSSEESTKVNARNALNWQIFVLCAFAALFILGVILQTVSGSLALLAILLIVALVVADVAFCLFAALKASKADQWTYPLAPTIV